MNVKKHYWIVNFRNDVLPRQKPQPVPLLLLHTPTFSMQNKKSQPETFRNTSNGSVCKFTLQTKGSASVVGMVVQPSKFEEIVLPILMKVFNPLPCLMWVYDLYSYHRVEDYITFTLNYTTCLNVKKIVESFIHLEFMCW